MDNPTHKFWEINLVLQLIQKSQIRVKLQWAAAHERKREFVYRLFCSREFFFNICVLSQCIVYWILLHLKNYYTYKTSRSSPNFVSKYQANTSKLFNSWNHQQTYGFGMICGEIKFSQIHLILIGKFGDDPWLLIHTTQYVAH